MRYTLRNVPTEVDRVLRQRAREQSKSLNSVAVEALRQAVDLGSPTRRDLSDITGTWKEDPEVMVALEEQPRIDAGMWD